MPEIQKELIERRAANSKTFDLANGKRQLVVSIGDVHYKDNYASAEPWKDIDLTWEGNRIIRAPYELTREGNKLTIRDKKSGEVSTIELLGGVGLDTDIEIEVQTQRVRFTRVLKSDKAPVEAKFRVTGKIPFTVRASDEDGDIPVESTLKDGILTETLKPDRTIKYPVRIDPTWQVGTGTDDCDRKLEPPTFSLILGVVRAGAHRNANYGYGSGMRFTTIAIPKGSIIDEAYLILRASPPLDVTTVNTRISAEAVDDAPTFANDAAAFDARFANHTTARVDWDNIPEWFLNIDYDSPEIKTVIKEIVDRGGWNSGNAIVIFWEDYDDRSTRLEDCQRQAYSYNGNTTYAPKLVIAYTSAAITVTPPTLALTTTTYIPTLVLGTFITPTTLAQAITTYIPSLIFGTGVTPTTLVQTLTEYAPVLELAITPTTLAITTTAYIPVLELVITPTTLAQALVFYTPPLIFGTGVIPTTLVLTSTTYIPTLDFDIVATPTTLALTLTEYAPVLKLVITPTTTALATTVYIPVLGLGVTPSTLVQTITTYIPPLVFGAAVTPITLTQALTAYIPTVVFDTTTTPTTLALSITGYVPLVVAPVLVTLTTLALAITAYKLDLIRLGDLGLITKSKLSDYETEAKFKLSDYETVTKSKLSDYTIEDKYKTPTSYR